MKWRRRLRWFRAALLLLVILMAIPVFYVETACRAPSGIATAHSLNAFNITDAVYSRPTTNSVLSYPEWYIVYAYQDFAAVLHDGDESRFRYLASTKTYWTGLCAVNRVASADGASDPSEKAMLYIIGWSFTAEMAIKGAYETTVGRLFAWMRGAGKSNEDRFAVAVADDYAQFLGQKAWYEYYFWRQVSALWGSTFDWSHPVRASERRFALTLEWGVKAVYAKAIGGLASLSPAPLQIQSVVGGLDDADRAAIPGIRVVKELGDGKQLIETPRYAAFTEIVQALAARNRPVLEIAGNDTIFATVLVPLDAHIDMDGVKPVFSDAIQSRPGWHRQGIQITVSTLTKTIQEIGARGATLEHLYDY